jgi:putative phosphoesterase
MKIAILSDIHDNVWKLQKALDWITAPENTVEALMICGDLCSPFVLGMIQSRFQRPVHLVFGNNDGDTFRLTHLAGSQVFIHGELAELTYYEGELYSGIEEASDRQGLSIAVNHYHDIAEGLIQSGRYNVVCYGHNHKHRIAYYDRASRKYVDRSSGDTILSINPGALMGFDPAPVREGEHDIPSTFVVLDLDSLETRTVEV